MNEIAISFSKGRASGLAIAGLTISLAGIWAIPINACADATAADSGRLPRAKDNT